MRFTMTRTLPVALPAAALLAAVFASSVAPAAPGGRGGRGGTNYGGVEGAKEPPPPPPVVIKFAGAERGRYYGKDALIVTGVAVLTGKPMKIAVLNEDMKTGKYEPKSDGADAFKSLKQGDYARIEMKYEEGQPYITKAAVYEVTPGEEQPNTYLFKEAVAQREGDVDYVVVSLIKYGEFIDAMLPLVKNKETKKLASDEEMLEAVRVLQDRREKGKLTDKILVEAEVVPGQPKATIRSIDPYKEPEPAKVVKFVADAEVSEGVKGPGLEVDQEGKTVTLPVTGKLDGKKWTPDAKALAAAKAAKPGSAVLVRTREAFGKTYLKDVKPAPKDTKTASSK